MAVAEGGMQLPAVWHLYPSGQHPPVVAVTEYRSARATSTGKEEAVVSQISPPYTAAHAYHPTREPQVDGPRVVAKQLFLPQS